MNSTHALYRFFDAEGELLYVGITMNPAARWPKHRNDKPWWAEVTDITLETFASRGAVLAAEKEAIKTEHPRYNVVHAEAPKLEPVAALIDWSCFECGAPINDGEGFLGISSSDMQRHERDLDAWVAKREGRSILSGDLLFSYPEPVQWLPVHSDCDDPDEPLDGYWADVQRLRTPALLLSFTAHLMCKRWLKTTNWDSIIARVAANGGI